MHYWTQTWGQISTPFRCIWTRLSILRLNSTSIQICSPYITELKLQAKSVPHLHATRGTALRINQHHVYSRVIGLRRQDWNGSPIWSGKQVHVGTWLTTVHSALMPQTPGQGSRQWLDKQAALGEQSLFMTHSGRQAPMYGLPMYGGMHEHRTVSSYTLHWAFSPHGDGEHGFLGTRGGTAATKKFKRLTRCDYCTPISNSCFKSAILTSWFLWATDERVALVAGQTRTIWRVIYDITFRIQSAGLSARISTFLRYASLVERTLRIHDTLRPAVRRTAQVIGEAGAHRMAFSYLADGIRSARRRIARIQRNVRNGLDCNRMEELTNVAYSVFFGRVIWKYIPGGKTHMTNGSPTWPGGQLQIGLWLMT